MCSAHSVFASTEEGRGLALRKGIARPLERFHGAMPFPRDDVPVLGVGGMGASWTSSKGPLVLEVCAALDRPYQYPAIK